MLFSSPVHAYDIIQILQMFSLSQMFKAYSMFIYNIYSPQNDIIIMVKLWYEETCSTAKFGRVSLFSKVGRILQRILSESAWVTKHSLLHMNCVQQFRGNEFLMSEK